MLHKIVEEESGEIRACSGAFGGAPYDNKKESSNRPMKSAQLKIAKLFENPSNEQSGEGKEEEKQNEKEEEK